jgi:hypothetical protein
MKISIISTNYYMSGSYVNFLDLIHYLVKDNITTFYYTQLDKNGYWLPHMIKKTGRDYQLGNTMKLYGNVWIKDDIVITDFRGLVICKDWGIPIVCSKLIVMDSVELSYHLNKTKDAPHWFDCEFSYDTEIYRYLDIHEYDEIVFLMPNVNLKVFSRRYPDLNAKEFYKKINYEALINVKHKNNGRFCYRTDHPNLIFKGLELVDIYDNLDESETPLFDYRGFIYHRRKRLMYWEQFGRLIFEYLMLGKEVRFAIDPFSVHDGLVDYINHYDIEFDDKRHIITKQSDIIERMRGDYNLWD